MKISLTSSRLRAALLAAVALVASAGLTADVGNLVFEMDNGEYLADVFSLSGEGNFPTWFSGGLHLTVALLLALVALGTKQSGQRFRRHWAFLSFAFFYISLDEFVTIHEKLNQYFDYDGALFFGWIIPAGVVLVAIGLAYRKFLAHLPRRTRRGFIVAGSVFVTGAVLMEIPLGLWFDAHGEDTIGYSIIDWIEETLEMCGIALMIAAVFDYMGRPSGILTVEMSETPGDTTASDAGEDAEADAQLGSRFLRKLTSDQTRS